MSAASLYHNTWLMDYLDTLTDESPEYREIIRKAEIFLLQPPVVVTNKKKSISGDIHNYESLSTYFWRDSTKSENASWVYRDGYKNPERLNYDGDKINQMWTRVTTLAKAYYLTYDKRYAEQWNKDISAWFLDKATRMNPNFEYAQIIMNSNNNHGNSHGIIDGYVLVDVVESMYIMDNLNALSKSTNKKLRKWFKEFSNWLTKSEMGKEQAAASNNLSLAYDVMLYSFWSFSNKKSKARNILDSFAVNRLQKQFLDDGSQPQELKRAKPVAYSLYNLEHVVDMCICTKAFTDKDYYNNAYTQSVINNAMTWCHTHLEQITLKHYSEIEYPDLKSLTTQYERIKSKISYL